MVSSTLRWPKYKRSLVAAKKNSLQMQIDFDTLDPIQLASLSVAFCALGATIWQAAISRRHNRLSVRPRLTLYRKEIEGQIYVKNNGTGPAIIKRYEVYYRGTPVPLEAAIGFFPVRMDVPHLTEGVAISAGDSVDLATAIRFLEAAHVEPMRALNFRIVYQSIYNEEATME